MSDKKIEIKEDKKDLLLINNTNLFDVYFKEEKKNFRILFDGKPLVITTPYLSIPFGVEKYNHTDILNLEFTGYMKNNHVYNFYATINQIDYFMKNLLEKDISCKLKCKLSKTLQTKLENKGYSSCIRERPSKYDPLLRTHLKHLKIETKDNSFKSIDKLKLSSAIATIELDQLWITDYNYGVTWMVTKITI